MEKITVRNAELGDLTGLINLCAELGYPATEEQLDNRLKKLFKSDSDIIYVAVLNTELLGWIHLFGTLRLESDPFAEIGGLVVSSEHRSKGIGAMLVLTAEKWAIENGFSKIRVRSRIERTDARRFYERGGYTVKKSQNVFEKSLE